MKAKILQLADDEGLPSVVEIDGISYVAMDCIGYGGPKVSEGDLIEAEFTVGIEDSDESWDNVFNGNPERIKKLICIKGWSYRAYGEIISINPVVVDCGVAKFEDAIDTLDPRCIGEFVAFNIKRLNVWSI